MLFISNEFNKLKNIAYIYVRIIIVINMSLKWKEIKWKVRGLRFDDSAGTEDTALHSKSEVQQTYQQHANTN